MSNERSDTSSSGRPSKVDDLKLINGIGPAVQRRLHGVGIYTYAQLASLSPADIAAAVADLAGLSAVRITKQDWTGQARRLSSELILNEAQEGIEALVEVAASIEHAHSSTSSDEIPPIVAELELSAPTVEVTEPDPPPVVSIIEPTGVPHLSLIETVLATAHTSQNFFARDQRFNVLLTLDLSMIRVPNDTQFSYRATIYRKSLEGRHHQVVGETSGIITSTHKVTLSVEGIALPKGVYRLKAIVILNLTTTELRPQNSLLASKESDLLLIF
ncbi:MAG: hypothetical protein ACXWPS_03050 [Ktedonobacteraceae bacterium]